MKMIREPVYNRGSFFDTNRRSFFLTQNADTDQSPLLELHARVLGGAERVGFSAGYFFSVVKGLKVLLVYLYDMYVCQIGWRMISLV